MSQSKIKSSHCSLPLPDFQTALDYWRDFTLQSHQDPTAPSSVLRKFLLVHLPSIIMKQKKIAIRFFHWTVFYWTDREVIKFCTSWLSGLQNLQHVDGRPVKEPVPLRGAERHQKRQPSGRSDSLWKGFAAGTLWTAGNSYNLVMVEFIHCGFWFNKDALIILQ